MGNFVGKEAYCEMAARNIQVNVEILKGSTIRFANKQLSRSESFSKRSSTQGNTSKSFVDCPPLTSRGTIGMTAGTAAVYRLCARRTDRLLTFSWRSLFGTPALRLQLLFTPAINFSVTRHRNPMTSGPVHLDYATLTSTFYLIDTEGQCDKNHGRFGRYL